MTLISPPLTREIVSCKPETVQPHHLPSWNKGKIVGQKRPFKLQEVWAIRIRLQLASRIRDLALFDLAIDSKLRGCDLVALRVSDVAHGQSILHRAIVLQRKTQRSVQFEITEPTRLAVAAWIEKAVLRQNDYLFPSRKHNSPHLSTRQYARIMERWVRSRRTGSCRVWYPHPAAHQGHTYLQTHQESSGRSALVGTHQTREYGSVLRH